MYVIPYILFLIFSIGMFGAARIFRFYNIHCRKNRDTDEEQGNESNHQRRISEQSLRSSRHSRYRSPRNSNTSIGESTVVALGLNDRIRLYRRTFDKNKHYHILSPKDFRRPSDDETSEDFSVGENDNDMKSLCVAVDDDINSVDAIDEEDPSWVYLPFTISESECSDSNDSTPCPSPKTEDRDEENATIKRDKDAIYSSHTHETMETVTIATSSTTITEGDNSDADPPITRVSGTCIICFETFKVGETVVWSNDTTKCRHVFHEDCMVRFLATHSKRTKRRMSSDSEGLGSAISYSYAENPCPICRRTFCTVKHDDLVMAVLLKSVAVALGEEEEDLPAHGGGGEGSPFTSSERSQRIAATTYALASATMGASSMPDRDSFHGDFSFDTM
mmetsp:Transcript_18881/g.38865  ORF Transcript_18881/g.38865 Transcript_18881/m.38865 type:complete len:391 (+) Transcript_18881:1-1173(+)